MFFTRMDLFYVDYFYTEKNKTENFYAIVYAKQNEQQQEQNKTKKKTHAVLRRVAIFYCATAR